MGTGWLVHFDAYLHRGPFMRAFYQTYASLQPSIPVVGAAGGLVPVPVVAPEVMQQERLG
jgi:hypothetical protein